MVETAIWDLCFNVSRKKQQARDAWPHLRVVLTLLHLCSDNTQQTTNRITTKQWVGVLLSKSLMKKVISLPKNRTMRKDLAQGVRHPALGPMEVPL
jgi:hypothetical protein